ncbi:putative peptidoglycan lipid II flippase [Geomicrobium halophilum]|uniref:Lipid II flippase n=1 Tax=Geomicrobium halophilum TaxID=549000 RepID=A0A841PZJ3_9BACL|nr:murein biosynthesis integral membrane protein MurJ [Geomicrobium halophilum]MBB6450393.1 putative peptidoglycan lipid II flippase [Geomicrobium halophilum]
MKGKQLLAIIGSVALINLLARFIGFFREVVASYQFGTSYQADSVIIAYTVPNFLYVVAGGAITTAFISIYSKINDPIEQRKYLESFFGWLSLGLIVLTLIFVFFSDALIDLLFTGLDTKTADLSNQLFQVMAPATLFLILSMWLMGLLNVNNRFTKAALATLIMNGSFLVIAIVFFPRLGPFAHGYGAIASAILMFVFLVYYNKRNQFFHFRPRIKRSPELGRTMKMMIPIMLGSTSLQLYFLLHRMFGSWLDEGFITALNHTSKLVQMPQTVLMTAVTTVIYPLLSRQVAKREYDSISRLYGQGLNMMALAIIPVSVFIYFFSEPLVSAIFQYGNFTEESTDMAVPLLQVFIIGMFFHAANVYITRFYYAYERSIYPLVVSLISVLGINVALNFILIEPYGAVGLAWGTTISAGCNFLLLFIGIRGILKWEKNIQWKAMFITVGKLGLLVASLCIGLAGFMTLFDPSNPFFALLSGGVVFLSLFTILLFVLRFPELDYVRETLNRKIGKKQ